MWEMSFKLVLELRYVVFVNRRILKYRPLYHCRYMITEERYGPLASMEVKDFVMTVGARSPSPGGGSVAALVATMVDRLFFNIDQSSFAINDLLSM